MGLYTVVIVGEGAYGNEDIGDIDNEAKGLISILKNHNHKIHDATLILPEEEGQKINLEED